VLGGLSDEDWQDFIQHLNCNVLGPLFFKSLQDLQLGELAPDWFFDQLRREYLNSIARNTRLYNGIRRVLTKLLDEGFQLIALKGLDLAQNVYGNSALRPMVDADLLVKREELPQVGKKILAMGYSATGYVGEDLDSSVHQHLPAFSKAGGPTIEVHWTIAHPDDPFTIDVDGLWNRARKITVSGINLLGLSPEDLLLYSSIHAAYQHKFEMTVIALADISETLKRFGSELDWQQFLHLAHEWKATRCAYVMLSFAKELLNARVSEDALQALRPSSVTAGIMAQLRAKILNDATSSPRLYQRFSQMQNAEGLRDKMAVVLRAVFPPRKNMALMYPASPASKTIYWYYLVHLKDLFLWHRDAACSLFSGSRMSVSEEMDRQSGEDRLMEWLKGEF